MSVLHLRKMPVPAGKIIRLPASKSLSNRALILHYLSNRKITIGNLSDAADTQILYKQLESTDEILDVRDAGTAMRFLTAYCCVANAPRVITGSQRMKQRPIAPLVDALQQIGFRVSYLEKQGYPPVIIQQLPDFNLLNNEVKIPGNISSQFLSALLMIAPCLPKGLHIKVTSSLSSEPYVMMTIEMLRQAKIEVKSTFDGFLIVPQPFAKTHFEIEADWTNALYWFSFAALSEGSKIMLEGLNLQSLQGDVKAATWMRLFGVDAIQRNGGVEIYNNCFYFSEQSSIHFNLNNYPDVAQTFMVLCAARNIKARFTGLESLRIKETDRIAAMQNELQKCGVELREVGEGAFELSGKFKLPDTPINTYKDHRMAMSFAPLCALGKITIVEPWVVEKSYPGFWKQFSF